LTAPGRTLKRIESLGDINEKASRIKTLMLDADGVLTDGSLYYDSRGEALKRFDVRDGSSIKWLQRAGIRIVVLTGRNSAHLAARMAELEVRDVIQGALIKLPVFQEFIKSQRLSPVEIAYMGDDLHDLPVMRRVGLSLAPADAAPEVKEQADWVAEKKGGAGAVREAAELILKAVGKWDEVTERYRE